MRGKAVARADGVVAFGIIPAGAGKRAVGVFERGLHKDHPRGCGEKMCRRATPSRGLGSSPRVRGKADESAGLPGDEGDHPRGCGEKDSAPSTPKAAAGSSPRVRGKAPRRGGRLRPQRIIPAGAGKRVALGDGLRGAEDHPRGCGEKTTGAHLLANVGGSSPRVRGKVAAFLRSRGIWGIIPAGAGKSDNGIPQFDRVEDHPRGCGEKCGMPGTAPPGEGSSPRVRGKDKDFVALNLKLRIIPAGAGKSPSQGRRHRRGRDHPRGCGEKGAPVTPRPFTGGSSPRVRGKDLPFLPGQARARIIPAGAGKSVFGAILPGAWRDHPRGCGEKATMSTTPRTMPGSSPRVRGKG